jgi:D-xylose reductase
VVEEQIPVGVTYKAMEQLVKDGLCKSIGVSNFNVALLRDLWNGAEIKPAVLQNELHPYLTCKVMAKFCNQKNICLTSYSTLGGTSYI